MEIINKVKVKDYVKRDELKNFQWNLKKQDNEKEIKKLADSILENWFTNPVVLWKNWSQDLIIWL